MRVNSILLVKGIKFENEMVNSAVTFSALTNPTLNKRFPQTSEKGPDAFCNRWS